MARVREARMSLPSISLEHPQLLWLLALAVPIVVLVPWRRLLGTRRVLSVAVIALRLLIVGLLVMALAEPLARPTGEARAVVFALDVSDSQTAEQQLWARAWMQRAARLLPAGSQWRAVEFGEYARPLDQGNDQPGGSSSDLEAALRMAAALLPRESALSPEIVVVSDGWNTAGALPPSAVPRGVAVSYLVPPRLGKSPGAVLRNVDVPPAVRVGDDVEVTIDMQAAEPLDANLRLWLDRELVVDEQVHLEPGDTRAVLPQRISSPGFLEFRAELRADETSLSTLSSVTVARPPGRVAVLEDQQGDADALVSLLRRGGLQISRSAANSVPPSASAMADFDAVVLVNTPATSLTLDQQRTLQSFVQDLGRGLLVIGGPRSFAPGGYEGSVLDELLPVSAEPPVEPQQGSLALILVIDRSGSMDVISGGAASGGASKIAMAREAAIQAADLLQPDDTLGVIGFDSSFQWVVQPTKLHTPDDVKRAQAQISAIKAGGGTSILQPLTAAYEAAAQADAPLKHIVLLTDGESNDRGYEDLIERMRPANITLSTLAIGSDSDTRLLSGLARLGGGRYYFTERSAQVPRIASKETTILTRNAIIEGQVAALAGEPSPVLRGLSGDFPSVTGYVATTRKDRAVTALETERGHPLLAHWQYGLGRVVVWASEAQQGWTQQWSNWPEAATFWSQALRWSLPAPVRSDFLPLIQVDPDGRHVALQVQAVRDDGRFADLQDTRATVVDPAGAAREVQLTQRAPGTYEFDTRVDAPGVYRVLFKQGDREETAGFSIPDAVEQHTVGANRALLDQLAREHGGRELRDPVELARPGAGPGPAIALWPWLLALAIILLPLDVYLRRRA
ncbi:MAG TPA: VWA domain-containing protein [Chloroflexota bacterium]|nr:VWA domain-containing protein [Chloroflexota bacterium]